MRHYVRHLRAPPPICKWSTHSVATKADLGLLKAELLAAFSNAINRMLIAQLAVAGLLFAALKLF